MTSIYITDTNSAAEIKHDLISVNIAKLYVFCLTIRMIAPLSFLQRFLGAAAVSFDVVPHLIGLLLILLKGKGSLLLNDDDEGNTILFFIKMVIWFTVSSLGMSVVMQTVYGNLGPESAFDGIKGMILYWAQYALILYYNYYVFKTLSLNELESILKLEVNFLLVIGYIQMAVMLFGGSIREWYDNSNILGILNSSERLPKLSLTGEEGAFAGYIMGTIIFPFLYASSLANKNTVSLLFKIILWLPLVYMTYSSAAYALFSLCTIAYIFFYIKTNGLSKLLGVLLGVFIVGIFAYYIFGNRITSILPNDFYTNIKYLLFEKVNDDYNGSTVMRSIPLHYNWGAFIEYPIFGVGNGNQGYFLVKYFPKSAYAAKGVDFSKWISKWTNGIANGALFWPSILSGYGIVGSILVIMFFCKCIRLINKKKDQLGLFYYYYQMAMIGVLLAGFATDFVSKYYIWFVVSIPFMSTDAIFSNLESKSPKNTRNKYIRV